jgi:hypothetical protein
MIYKIENVFVAVCLCCPLSLLTVFELDFGLLDPLLDFFTSRPTSRQSLVIQPGNRPQRKHGLHIVARLVVTNETDRKENTAFTLLLV